MAELRNIGNRVTFWKFVFFVFFWIEKTQEKHKRSVTCKFHGFVFFIVIENKRKTLKSYRRPECPRNTIISLFSFKFRLIFADFFTHLLKQTKVIKHIIFDFNRVFISNFFNYLLKNLLFFNWILNPQNLKVFLLFLLLLLLLLPLLLLLLWLLLVIFVILIILKRKFHFFIFVVFFSKNLLLFIIYFFQFLYYFKRYFISLKTT